MFAKKKNTNPQKIIMCNVSPDIVIRANGKTSTGVRNRVCTDTSMTVSATYRGKVYSKTFSNVEIKKIYSKSLTRVL